MNYYEHHIGDYVEATAHLSFIEDGAYGRLIRKYYAMEQSLPPDVQSVQRLCGCRTPQERNAVVRVLNEFFELREDGWHQARCDEEIARFKAKSEAARASAGARWNNANASNPHMRNGSGRNANASNPHDVRNALQSPVSSNQSPVTTHTDSRAPNGARVGVRSKSGWTPPKTPDDYEREEAAKDGGTSAGNPQERQSHGGRHAGR